MTFLEFVRGGLASDTYLIICVGAAVFCAYLVFRAWMNRMPETAAFAWVCVVILLVAFGAHFWAASKEPDRGSDIRIEQASVYTVCGEEWSSKVCGGFGTLVEREVLL